MNRTKAIIYNLKDINAEHLLKNKCQPYAEGVESAWSAYNSIVATQNNMETNVKMKLALAYSAQENARNNAELEFQTGIIDFFEYVLEY